MKKLYNLRSGRHTSRYKFIDNEKDVILYFSIKRSDGAIEDVVKLSKGRRYEGVRYYKAHEKDIHEAIKGGN